MNGDRLELGGYVFELSSSGEQLSILHDGSMVLPSRKIAQLLFKELMDIGRDLDTLRPALEAERARSAQLLDNWQEDVREHDTVAKQGARDRARADQLALELERVRAELAVPAETSELSKKGAES